MMCCELSSVLFIRTANFDDERISSIGSGFSVVIDGVDGELGRLVVEDELVEQSISIGPALAWVAKPLDLGMEGSILDGITVEIDIDVVLIRLLDGVEDRCRHDRQ